MNHFGQQPLFNEMELSDSSAKPKSSKPRQVSEQQRKLDSLLASMESISKRLLSLESTVQEFVHSIQTQRMVKESYTTQEAAKLLGKRPYTVREWCRNGRVRAFKPGCGRGSEEEWRISHEELTRIQNEGLLPQPHKVASNLQRKTND